MQFFIINVNTFHKLLTRILKTASCIFKIHSMNFLMNFLQYFLSENENTFLKQMTFINK